MSLEVDSIPTDRPLNPIDTSIQCSMYYLSYTYSHNYMVAYI